MRLTKSRTLALLPVLLIAFAACASPNTASPDESQSESPTPTQTPTPTAEAVESVCPPTPIEVTITYELVQDSSGGVSINAQTNVPDGSVMNADFFIEGSFLAQDDGIVQDGKISFGPYSDKGSPLQGTYSMSITLPIARVQPDAVQECIGSAGENLTGALVTSESITGDKTAGIDVLVTFD